MHHARASTVVDRYVMSIQLALRCYDLTPTGARAQRDWVHDDNNACGLQVRGSQQGVLRSGSLPSRAATTLIAALSALLWAAVVLVIARLAAGI